MEFRTLTFIGPSGYSYTLREQNGADEDIISNVADARNLMNLTKLIMGLVVNTDFTSTGRLTLEDTLNLPINDRYAILFKSRIFSIGEEVEFEYDWGKDNGGTVTYGQDLNEYLFDYSIPAEKNEELGSKPDAIPYYPLGKVIKDHSFVTSSGKEVIFDCLNGKGEQKLIQTPLDKQSRNLALVCRNLRLKVDDKYEVVENFSLFSVRDMAEIRKEVFSIDPLFQGECKIQNPNTGQEISYPIIMAPDFFFLTGGY